MRYNNVSFIDQAISAIKALYADKLTNEQGVGILFAQKNKIAGLEAELAKQTHSAQFRRVEMLLEQNGVLKAELAEYKSQSLMFEEVTKDLTEKLAEANRLIATMPIGKDWDKMCAKLTKAEEALEKLARLGNGTQYGNSDGNMIARNYLEGK